MAPSSLAYADNEAAVEREGLPSVWINRRHDRPGWGATPEPSVEWTYHLEFSSLGQFADAVAQAFGAD